MNKLTNAQNRNGKINVTIRQWEELLRKEMSYSEDLRNNDRIEEIEAAIKKSARNAN